MHYTLTTPVTIGDFDHQIVIDVFEIVSFSVNIEPTYKSAGVAVISIGLMHLASGYRKTITYKNAAALTWWTNNLEAYIIPKLFNRIISDNKLPPGTLSA